MLSLFDTNSTHSGYRLKSFEVFNWGTFHEGNSKQDIWKLSLEGNNTLLTGANGSGKTTLVDGLLSLLVNPQKRFFNQSSGVKRDRTEESYVEGHFGRTQNDEQTNSKVEKLRPSRQDTYSIILGVFTNSSSVPITLVQVRWFNNGGLQKKYLIAKMELSIGEHIKFGSDGGWLRSLKRQYSTKIEDFDSFPKYATTFQRLFGMKSDKALTLFNQTVGMKVLGNLDEFIRTNMLEESTAEADFGKLMDNYQTLLTAYQALEKARIQLDLLKPINDFSEKYQRLVSDLEIVTNQKRLLEPWFTQQQIRLWENEIERQDREGDRLIKKLGNQEQELGDIVDKRIQLEVSIGNNQVDQQIKSLERDIKDAEKSKKEKFNNSEAYNRLARRLGFIENPEALIFRQNQENAVILQADLKVQKLVLNNQIYEVRVNLEAKKVEFEKTAEEIRQLENSSSKITGRVAEIRQEILKAIEVSEIEIPFVAEIIQVKPEEKKVWNNAIEKVLHGLGLCLLVPEKYYSEINSYIHSQRDLRGKIVYFKVEGKIPNTLFRDNRPFVVTKLDFNPNSKFIDWVENQIVSRFGYLCTENLAEFERSDKALMPSGLVRNKNRHERDDNVAHRHILGWDNRELLGSLKRKATELNAEITKLERQKVRLDDDVSVIEAKESNLNLFLIADNFSALNWQDDALKITALTKDKEVLESSNVSLKEMKRQLEELKRNIAKLEKEKESTRDDFKEIERKIKELKEQQRNQKFFLENFDSENLKEELKQVDEITFDLLNMLDYQGFIKIKDTFERKIQGQILELGTQKNTQERNIRVAMGEYKNPEKRIQEKFTDWNSDTYNLKAEIDQLPEYLDLYEQIKTQNLAELEKRFRDEFKDGVVRNLSDFCSKLEEQHDKIIDTIDEINESLINIPFNHNPDTFIQLERIDTKTPMIRDFRNITLRSWQPDRSKIALAQDPKEADISHFVERIKPFVEQLQKEEKWRREVTDVRRWSDFKAKESFKTDKHVRRVYESSEGLSTGEKAQLTYAILISSIANQFGINREHNNNRSFRFIVVDEAFANLDDNKSEYLLQLCKSLGIQLMSITPQNAIQLVEDYVSVIHWVTKGKQDTRISTVRNIPILEYKEHKEEFIEEESLEYDNA
jgi:uncharacterized protein YPO0396